MKASRLLYILNNVTPMQLGTYTLATDSYVSVGIYLASAPTKLIRTLGKVTYQTAGAHTIYWDGLDDDGNDVIATNDYVAKVYSHNTSHIWGTIGNSSSVNHGENVFRSYTFAVSAAVSGNNLYFGEGYNEGGARKGFKVVKNIDIQSSINILPASTDPNATNPNDTNVEPWYVATNGTNVYWYGIDPGATFYGTYGAWGYATSVATDANVALSSGTSQKAGYGATYPNAFGIKLNDVAEYPTGLACNSSYVWVARAAANRLDVYNATTGAFISSQTISNVREIAYDSAQDKVWGLRTLSGDTESLFEATVSGTGALNTPSLSGLTFPATGKLTLAIDNVAHTLAIAVGGGNQNVWLFNITGASPTGAFSSKIGTTGGNESTAGTAIVTDTTFLLQHTNTSLSKPFITFDSSSNIFIGDVGNNRIQIFNSSNTYQNTICWLPAMYSVSMNMTDCTEVSAHWMVFDRSTGALLRNYRGFVAAKYNSAEKYDIFKYWSTLSNGKTYVTMNDNTTYAFPALDIYEMTSSALRFTGVTINTTDFFTGTIDSSFTIRVLTSASAFSIGSSPILKEQHIISFSSDNPVYSSLANVVTLDPIATGDAISADGESSFAGLTSSGICIFKNENLTDSIPYHLEGYDVTTGEKLFSQFRCTTDNTNPPFTGYIGNFPDPRYYDIGNTTWNTMTGAKVLGNIFYTLFKGEGWSQVQTNYQNFYYKGVPIYQSGTNRQKSQAIEVAGEQSAGNALSYILGTDGTDYFLVHGDESVHSSIHLWTYSGMNAINEQTVNLLPPPNAEPLEGADLLTELTFNSAITDTTHINVTGVATGLKAECGVMSYDKYEPDIALVIDASAAANNSTVSVDVDVYPVYNPLLSSHKLFGEINFRYGGGTETAGNPPTAYLQILDNTGLVIAQITLEQVNVTDAFTLKANSTTVLNFTDSNTRINVIGKWQPFTIITSSDGCDITYGSEPTVSTTLMNSLADWSKPTTVRVMSKKFTSGDGLRRIAVKKLRYVEYTTSTAPVIVSAETISTTQIEVVFDMGMTVTSTGWSASKGVNLNLASVTGSGDRWVFTVDPMTDTDIITISYNSTIGNSVNGYGTELGTVSNLSVVNNITPASVAVLLQSKVDSVGGSGVLAFDSAVTAGSLIVVQFAGTIDLDNATCLDSVVGAYNFAVKSRNGYSKSTNMFYYYNHPGGSATITCAGINSAQVTAIYEYGGVVTATNPLLDSGGALGSSSPLQDSLTFANNSLLVVHWYNEGTDDYTGLVGANVVVQHSVANYNLQGHKLSQAATTMNVGVTTGGNGDNVMTCAAFKLI